MAIYKPHYAEDVNTSASNDAKSHAVSLHHTCRYSFSVLVVGWTRFRKNLLAKR